MPLECFPERRRDQLLSFRGEEGGQATGIKQIERHSQLGQISQAQPPAMPQIRSSFERAIISGIIKTRQLSRIFRAVMEDEIISSRVLSVKEQKTAFRARFNADLPDAAQACCQPISERAFLRESAHFNARAIRKAACSRKSRSSSVKAFSFSLSTSINPTTLSDSVMTGTTISEFVLPNVGR